VLAAAAACAAIALAVWTASLSGSLDRERQARQAEAQAIGLVATPGARRIPLAGARGALVRTPQGEAALVVTDLARAPQGKTYEVWVLAGGRPQPAGVFAGGPDRSIVALTRPVPARAGVAVSLEAGGGSTTLHGPLLFRSETA
jgi:anti-sigma-K factor RskA